MNPLATTPRQPKNAMSSILRAHKFYVVFNIMWNGIVFSIIGAFGAGAIFSEEETGLDLCFTGAFMSIFVVAGIWLFVSLLRKIIRDRWLLTYGVLSQGHITSHSTHSTASQNGRPATRIIWNFEDHLGQTQKGEMETFNNALISSHPVDKEVDVLFDPTDPTLSTLPSLLKATFKPPAAIRDLRPDLSDMRHAKPTNMHALTQTQSLNLATLPRRARSGCLAPKLSNEEMPTLKLSPQGIKQFNPAGDELAAIFWDSPFAVQLTAWPQAHGQLELGVTLVQRGGHAGSKGRVRFQIEIEQKSVDQRLLIQQLKAPYMELDTWRTLWPALMFYAQVHGEDLHEHLDLS